MTFEESLQTIINQNVASETEVRTKIATPLFELLGYSAECRAEAFPIFGYEGRTPLHSKEADTVYFDTLEHHLKREREDRYWVQDHSLIVVELKSPHESMDARGQSAFYSMWSRVPFYVISNGVEIHVYRIESYFSDHLEFSCLIKDLSQRWAELERLLNPDAVLAYCRQNRLKAHDPRQTDYSDYVRAKHSELGATLDSSLSRTISEHFGSPLFIFPLSISPDSREYALEAQNIGTLIQSTDSAVVLAEPGGGKTYLIQLLALDSLHNKNSGTERSIPIILLAKLWGRSFSSIKEGIRKELEWFIPGLTDRVIEDDLRQNRFLILLDGLDEVLQDFDLLINELNQLTKNIGLNRTTDRGFRSKHIRY
jgi:Type I restriction enzyme R protein N terminus (HSDR_N)